MDGNRKLEEFKMGFIKNMNEISEQINESLTDKLCNSIAYIKTFFSMGDNKLKEYDQDFRAVSKLYEQKQMHRVKFKKLQEFHISNISRSVLSEFEGEPDSKVNSQRNIVDDWLG